MGNGGGDTGDHSSFWNITTSGQATGVQGSGWTTGSGNMTTTDGNANNILDIYENATSPWDPLIWVLTPGAYPTLQP